MRNPTGANERRATGKRTEPAAGKRPPAAAIPRRPAGFRKCVAVIAGNSESGKTSLAISYLANTRHAARFIFDPDAGAESSYSRRLRYPAARTPGDLITQLLRGTVLFDPDAIFPGRREEGFAFFLDWTLAKCRRLPGRKLVIVDELWRYCSPYDIPGPLTEIIQTGRHFGIELLALTQNPNRIHNRIWNECTELIAFRLQSRATLDTIEEYGLDRAEVAQLPKLHFAAVNRAAGNGEIFRGRVRF